MTCRLPPTFNSARTRNARLAAIHSLFRYAALSAPEDADIIGQVLAIEGSRVVTTDISWLTHAESQALLDAPDQGTWIGRRNRLNRTRNPLRDAVDQ
jgi:integrase/recombinase XerD